MRIIRAADCRTTPWKNGGGSTTEIAASPDGASLDTFDWRISMARVASDGPFSDFPGIDRTLTVIAGDGMVLTIGGERPVTLSKGSTPMRFAGELPTSARLMAGAITDLNVMTRRGRFSHQVARVTQPMACEPGDRELAVVLSLEGETKLASASSLATLAHGDAAIIDRADDVRILAVTGDCYLVRLWKLSLG